jgi:hypothetical protein
VGVGTSEVKSAVTDQGESLAALSIASPPVEPALTTLGLRSRSLSMKAPTKPARKVTIEGVLPVEIGVNLRQRLDVPLSEVMPGKRCPLIGGGWLRSQTLQLRAGYTAATFQVTAEAALASDSRRWRLDLTDEAGRTHRGYIYPVLEAARQDVVPGDLMLLSGAGQVPWSGLAWLTSDRGGLRTIALSAYFSTPEAPGPGSRLRLSSMDRERIELPFTFRDLPLP